MAKKLVWIGGAPAKARAEKYTLPADIESGQVLKATIGLKTITYTFPDGPLRPDVVDAFVSVWDTAAEDIPEFTAVSITDNGDGSFNLTAEEAGKPFVVTITIGTGTNEIQVVTLVGSPTGGSFTLDFAGQETANIASDASEETVQTALEGLSNIEVGDVLVTGDAGGPWTIEFQGALSDTDVALLLADDTLLEGTNEEQTITLASCSGGTFALEFGEETTDPIAHNADAATIQSELEALTGIGAGNVTVSGTGPWVVEFIGDLKSTNVSLITVDGSNLTGVLDVSIDETTPGGGGSNELWNLALYGDGAFDGAVEIYGSALASGGTFTISISVDSDVIMTTAPIAYDATIQEVQAAIAAVGSIANNGNYMHGVCVWESASTGTGQLSDGDRIYLWISPETAKTAASNAVSVTINNTSMTGGVYSAGTPSNPTFSSTATDFSSFYIQVDGFATDDLDVASTIAQIQAAVEALPNVGVGNVLITGDVGAYTFVRHLEFIGSLANQDTGKAVTIGTNNVDIGGHVTITFKILEGISGTGEVQTLSIAGSPGAGTFALRFGGDDTTLLDFDSTAEEIETALQALDSIGAADVSCSGGALPDTPVVITFAAALSGQDLDPIEVIYGHVAETVAGGGLPSVEIKTTQTKLAYELVTENEGPNDWNTAANWDTLSLPEDDDTAIIPDGANILYGLDQSGLSLALLEIHRSDTQIGLPRRTDANDIEYLPRYLKLTATKIVIGLGAGSGSQRINIDYGSSSPEIEVYGSASGQNGEHAIQLIGVNAVNTATLLVLDGDVGVATGPKEAAYLKQITQRGGQVWTGSDVGLEGIDRTGGLYRSDRTIIDGLVTL